MSIQINYVGHSCFEIVAPDATILVDPFLSPNNPSAAKSAADFAPDAVASTHGHVDHMADALEVVKSSGADFCAMVEVANWFSAQGLEKVADLNLGGTAKYDWGSIQLVPALHTNTLPDGTVIGPAAGLVLQVGETRIYHLGDTALFSDLALVKRRAPVDVAIVPIGGWYTMDPEDAAEAVRLIEPRIAIPCHYNTFPVIEQDPQEFARLVGERCSSKVEVLAPGESLEV